MFVLLLRKLEQFVIFPTPENKRMFPKKRANFDERRLLYQYPWYQYPFLTIILPSDAFNAGSAPPTKKMKRKMKMKTAKANYPEEKYNSDGNALPKKRTDLLLVLWVLFNEILDEVDIHEKRQKPIIPNLMHAIMDPIAAKLSYEQFTAAFDEISKETKKFTEFSHKDGVITNDDLICGLLPYIVKKGEIVPPDEIFALINKYKQYLIEHYYSESLKHNTFLFSSTSHKVAEWTARKRF